MTLPPLLNGSRSALIALLLVGTLGLSSCSLVPARLKMAVSQEEHLIERKSLPSLLEEALGDGDEANHALAHFVEKWKKSGKGPKGTISHEEGGKTWQVSFQNHSAETFDFNYFDELYPAEDFEVDKIPHYKRPGIGAPMVGFRLNRHQEAIEAFYPEEGITRALTATVEENRNGKVTINLVCPLRFEATPKNQSQALAADFSTPWAALLERTGKLWRTGVTDVLTRKTSRPPQLYLMESYDPNKQPLIMIHGLFSTPLAWARLSNEVWADEDLRKRYQIWHYQYNTSAPPLYASRQLRNRLKSLRALIDPKGKHFASKRTTLLTHSMGGLVGKALVVEPKDAFWKAAFTVPPESLKLRDEDRRTLNNAFEWKSERSIGRIIFNNVPHRGADSADGFLGRLGRIISAPPKPFQSFYQRISKDNPNAFTPAYADLSSGKLDSFGTLSPKQPSLGILDSLPPAHPVIYHSIIGTRGRKGPLEKSSDGVVTWERSHFPRAVSELAVPSGHGSFNHPDALKEIKRILKLPDGVAE